MHKDLILWKIELSHDTVEISRHEDASNLVTQGLIFDSILHLAVLAFMSVDILFASFRSASLFLLGGETHFPKNI